ncbi:hypothetical protein D9M73_225780 [compost metagenome]
MDRYCPAEQAPTVCLRGELHGDRLGVLGSVGGDGSVPDAAVVCTEVAQQGDAFQPGGNDSLVVAKARRDALAMIFVEACQKPRQLPDAQLLKNDPDRGKRGGVVALVVVFDC